MEILFDYISWQDAAVAVSLLVGFLMVAPFGRKTYWRADMALSGLFGLALVFVPHLVADYQVSKSLDAGHTGLLRVCGAFLICRVVSLWLLRSSHDEKMFGAYFFANAKFMSIMIMCLCVSYQQLQPRKMGIKFSDKFVWFTMPALALGLLGNVVQLFKYRQLGSYIHRTNYLQFGLYVDNFAVLVHCMAILIFPSHLLKYQFSSSVTTDQMHVAFFRMAACLALHWSFMSQAATGFLYPADKKSYLMARIVAVVLPMFVGLFESFVTGAFSDKTLYGGAAFGVLYVLFLLSLLRSFEGRKEK